MKKETKSKTEKEVTSTMKSEPLTLIAKKSAKGLNITIEIGDFSLIECSGIANYFFQIMNEKMANFIKNQNNEKRKTD
jgi:hypothetical protein